MKMKKLQNMMKQAQQAQEQIEREMREMRFEGSSGGGVVTVEMDGSKAVKSVRIKPEAVDPEDVEILQEMVMAAFNEASRQVDGAMSDRLGGLAGGLLG